MSLKQAIRDRAFDPVYYFHGDDEFLKEDAARRLAEAVVDPSTRDFNLETRRGGDLDGEVLGSLLGTPPMMAERRMIVVRDVAALKKDARAALDRYLERPASDLVLLLIAAAGTKPDKTLIDRCTPVEFKPLGGDKLAKWITHHVTTALGTTITPEASELLQTIAGNDLPALASELDKLASYASGGEIDEAAVSAVVGVRRGQTLGDLIDRVIARDAPGALEILPDVLQQPKISAVTIVMALSAHFFAMAWGRAAGLSARRMEGECFGFLKEAGGMFVGRSWGDLAKACGRGLDGWTEPALERALDALLAADVTLKETRLSSEEQVLSTLVLTLCAPMPLAAGAPEPPARRGTRGAAA
jgi:DNA polymerase-3 subunit delta